MKNKLLSLLLFLLVSISFAQVTFKPGLRFGANFSEITKAETYKGKTGFYIGVFGELKFTEFYALQPEIYYGTQGAEALYTDQEDIDLKYVTLGLANKFFIAKGTGLHLIVGPSIDVNVDYNWVNIVNDEVDYDLSPIDISIFGGLGYEFPFGLVVEARIKQGLVDLDLFNDNDYDDNNDDTNNYNDENQLNKVFQLGVIYKFKF
ncbi:porin family protein [Neotamlana laminarinivorans]|uniref:PorT family protein n=1 Tax=Neotamlana laminarinivorans TaxID=2883124 RepID=A0A9X1I0E7_9FLAO|nr:porin family protein [Tamlana laminarinivorans]MCB4799504.1 PorT family protein [Tamlana laminarinivorans]